MGVGFGGLVGFAAALGPALVPLARLAGAELPEGLWLAVVLGVVLALGGLVLGWFVPAGLLLGPLRGLAETGFASTAGSTGLWPGPLSPRRVPSMSWTGASTRPSSA